MSTNTRTIGGGPARVSLIVLERDKRLLILETNEGLMLPGGFSLPSEADGACLLRTVPEQMPSVAWSKGGFTYWRTFPYLAESEDDQRFLKSYFFDPKELDLGNLGFYGQDVTDIHSYWYGREDLELPRTLVNIVEALHAERLLT